MDTNTDPYGASNQPDPTNPNLVGGFSSSHKGAVGFAFGDGSVRHVRESITRKVLRSLANRSDGPLLEEY
jgi:prepilin-type processing-associated H-X9-DG protein